MLARILVRFFDPPKIFSTLGLACQGCHCCHTPGLEALALRVACGAIVETSHYDWQVPLVSGIKVGWLKWRRIAFMLFTSRQACCTCYHRKIRHNGLPNCKMYKLLQGSRKKEEFQAYGRALFRP
jgi:hypothetical protein